MSNLSQTNAFHAASSGVAQCRKIPRPWQQWEVVSVIDWTGCQGQIQNPTERTRSRPSLRPCGSAQLVRSFCVPGIGPAETTGCQRDSESTQARSAASGWCWPWNQPHSVHSRLRGRLRGACRRERVDTCWLDALVAPACREISHLSARFLLALAAFAFEPACRFLIFLLALAAFLGFAFTAFTVLCLCRAVRCRCRVAVPDRR